MGKDDQIWFFWKKKKLRWRRQERTLQIAIFFACLGQKSIAGEGTWCYQEGRVKTEHLQRKWAFISFLFSSHDSRLPCIIRVLYNGNICWRFNLSFLRLSVSQLQLPTEWVLGESPCFLLVPAQTGGRLHLTFPNYNSTRLRNLLSVSRSAAKRGYHLLEINQVVVRYSNKQTRRGKN